MECVGIQSQQRSKIGINQIFYINFVTYLERNFDGEYLFLIIWPYITS